MSIQKYQNKVKTFSGDKKSGASKASDFIPWGTQGDFTTTHPLPVVKVKLFTESTGVLALEDKELGRVVLNPTTNGPKSTELHKMVIPKNSQDSDLKIKLAVRMDKPPNMKHSGYLYALGQRVWKRWKRRYCVLVQVSQYTFAMCSYREKKSEPHELMQLDGYTVDYSDPQPGLQGGQAFFSAVKEGDLVVFATNDEQDRSLWVQAMYRATGQSYKPVPPAQNQQHNCRGGNIQKDAPASLLSRPYYPSRAQPSCLSTSVCHRQAALAEVTGGAVPVISVLLCVNICHEAHVHLGGSRHMNVTAAMKTETGAGFSLLYWASCLRSSALIRDDGPRPPPPLLVYR
ncbi:calcium-dependent secretion activator 2 isoform X1 [Tachysurus ichikawai]